MGLFLSFSFPSFLLLARLRRPGAFSLRILASLCLISDSADWLTSWLTSWLYLCLGVYYYAFCCAVLSCLLFFKRIVCTHTYAHFVLHLPYKEESWLADWLIDTWPAERERERERNEMCKEEEEEEDSRLVISLLLMLAVVKQYAPLVFALCSPTLVFAVSVFLLTMLAASFCIALLFRHLVRGKKCGDGCRICARALSGLSSGSDLRDFLFCSFILCNHTAVFVWVCRISSGLVLS